MVAQRILAFKILRQEDQEFKVKFTCVGYSKQAASLGCK